MLVEWTEQLSVGIEEIDEQHKILVGLLNDLHRSIVEHHGSEQAMQTLDKLVEYTRIHFAVEESLMRILGYPDYEEHKEHHEMLITEIGRLQQKLRDDHKSITFELLHFLKTWLTKHILDDDMAYVDHFISVGVKTQHAKQGLMNRLWHSIAG
ncbi:hemerythrin [Pelagibaculum spongiae]|uniref:Hemerythrin n=1 Tax=Pelagibaculum spongiae TaxID=2080658 RepID=A0A2V1GUP9_9GAMM|nr:hemerythrin [Pelagibaculum spongiae]